MWLRMAVCRPLLSRGEEEESTQESMHWAVCGREGGVLWWLQVLPDPGRQLAMPWLFESQKRPFVRRPMDSRIGWEAWSGGRDRGKAFDGCA